MVYNKFYFPCTWTVLIDKAGIRQTNKLTNIQIRQPINPQTNKVILALVTSLIGLSYMI